MSTQDFAKQFQELIISESQKLLGADSIAAPNDMLGKMVEEIEAAIAQGVELPPQIFEQVVLLKTMQGRVHEIEATMTAGDSEAALAMSRQFAIDNGVMGADDEPHPEIFVAIENGNLDAVKTCLTTWDVNHGHGNDEVSALYYGVSQSGIEPSFPVMHALLDAGADPNRGLGHSYNVLQGLGFGYYQLGEIDDLIVLIKRCVALGADIEHRSENLNWTPLHTALMEWNVPVATALLRAGADPNAAATADAEGCTAGQTCLGMSSTTPDLFELLLDHGADPDFVDAFGDTVQSVIVRNMRQSDDADFTSALARSLEILGSFTSKH